MIIKALVENTSIVGFPIEHGLSLHIKLNDGKQILFDMGQGKLFASNAERMGVDISSIDIAVISHGHYDHGGGLSQFLDLNKRAKVYIHSQAFVPHYSLRDTGMRFIGLDETLEHHEQVVLCNGTRDLSEKTNTSDSFILFSDVNGDECNPVGNRLLYGPDKTCNDSFSHEQNLIIREGKNIVLFAGCAHQGIVNIIRKATDILGKSPTHIFAGMHLVKSGLSEDDENAFIKKLSQSLLSFDESKYFTMHCTGTEQFDKMKSMMGERISYLSCGECVRI